jgi:hypothetical protein
MRACIFKPQCVRERAYVPLIREIAYPCHLRNVDSAFQPWKEDEIWCFTTWCFAARKCASQSSRSGQSDRFGPEQTACSHTRTHGHVCGSTSLHEPAAHTGETKALFLLFSTTVFMSRSPRQQPYISRGRYLHSRSKDENVVCAMSVWGRQRGERD